VSDLWVFVESFGSSDAITLSADEARHVAARRLHPGDRLVAFDGAGGTAVARLDSIGKRAVEIRIEEVAYAAAPEGVWVLATAIPKGERLAVMLPMLSQLAVTVWQPLSLQESVVRDLDVASARLRRILVESAKLARRPWLLEIRPPCDLGQLLDAAGTGAGICFGDREGDRLGIPSDASVVAIGPEAGFTPEELRRLRSAGAQACRLGPHNMRIETAAVAAAATRFSASGMALVANER
jgi:16S rRNA (uracil1498-N3)-methyltransferase